MTALRQFREQVASMQLEIGAADVLDVPLHESYPSIVVQLQPFKMIFGWLTKIEMEEHAWLIFKAGC